MKIIETLNAWLRRQSELRRERDKAQRAEEAEEESRRRLQVREFHGSVYLCIDDVPLLEADNLRQPLHIVLDDMRTVYKVWRTEGWGSKYNR